MSILGSLFNRRKEEIEVIDVGSEYFDFIKVYKKDKNFPYIPEPLDGITNHLYQMRMKVDYLGRKAGHLGGFVMDTKMIKSSHKCWLQDTVVVLERSEGLSEIVGSFVQSNMSCYIVDSKLVNTKVESNYNLSIFNSKLIKSKVGTNNISVSFNDVYAYDTIISIDTDDAFLISGVDLQSMKVLAFESATTLTDFTCRDKSIIIKDDSAPPDKPEYTITTVKDRFGDVVYTTETVTPEKSIVKEESTKSEVLPIEQISGKQFTAEEYLAWVAEQIKYNLFCKENERYIEMLRALNSGYDVSVTKKQALLERLKEILIQDTSYPAMIMCNGQKKSFSTNNTILLAQLKSALDKERNALIERKSVFDNNDWERISKLTKYYTQNVSDAFVLNIMEAIKYNTLFTE